MVADMTLNELKRPKTPNKQTNREKHKSYPVSF